MGYDDYYPFGKRMPGRSLNTSNPHDAYKFTGKELDQEDNIDLAYFGARYYDPEIGRWMSVDPMAKKYPGLSPYNYVQNNPVNATDPNGKGPLSGALIGFSVSVATQYFITGKVNWRLVGAATLAGALTGGISAVDEIYGITIGSGTKAVLTGAVNVWNGYTESRIMRRPFTSSNAVLDLGIGGLSSYAGEFTGNFAADHTAVGNRLGGIAERALSRDERVGSPLSGEAAANAVKKFQAFKALFGEPASAATEKGLYLLISPGSPNSGNPGSGILYSTIRTNGGGIIPSDATGVTFKYRIPYFNH